MGAFPALWLKLVAMDPLHITEFASKRYYEKLDQLPKDQQQTQQQNESRAVEGSSKFILPIRHAEQHGHESALRHADPAKFEKEKRGLFGRLRSSKPSVPAAPADPYPGRRPSTVSVPSTTSVGEKRRRYVGYYRTCAWRIPTAWRYTETI